MSNSVNLKVVEVKAYSKEEAGSQVPFQVVLDATQAWKAAGSPAVGSSLEEFALAKLRKETKLVAGAGVIVSVDPGVKDTKQFPYDVVDVVGEGQRKWETVLEFINRDTKEIVATFTGKTKLEAKAEAKAYLAQNRIPNNFDAVYKKVVVEGEPLAFSINYSPSIRTHLGTYLLIGIPAL